MTGGPEDGLMQPHILIVGMESMARGRLRNMLNVEGMDSEQVIGTNNTLERLANGDPSATGLLTGTLHGEYLRVMQAARDLGVNAVLLTHSQMTVREVRAARIPAYLQSKIVGPSIDKSMRRSLIEDLLSPPESC